MTDEKRESAEEKLKRENLQNDLPSEEMPLAAEESAEEAAENEEKMQATEPEKTQKEKGKETQSSHDLLTSLNNMIKMAEDMAKDVEDTRDAVFKLMANSETGQAIKQKLDTFKEKFENFINNAEELDPKEASSPSAAKNLEAAKEELATLNQTIQNPEFDASQLADKSSEITRAVNNVSTLAKEQVNEQKHKTVPLSEGPDSASPVPVIKSAIQQGIRIIPGEQPTTTPEPSKGVDLKQG